MAGSVGSYTSRDWWVLTLTGVTSILFGIAAVFWPGITLVTLVYLFSAYILVMGVIGIIDSLANIGSRRTWILSLLLGILQIGVGVYLVRHLAVSFATLIIIIGFTLIIRGVVELVRAFGDNQTASHRTMLVIGGLLGVVAGIFILTSPVSGGLAFVWILGLYALLTGPLMIAISLDVKSLEEDLA